MKKSIKNLLILPVLLTGLGLMLAGRVAAQTFKVLHSFTGSSSEGANPRAGLILSGNTLYGTTFFGGSDQDGTVFAVNTDGKGFTNLHNFYGLNEGSPTCQLILSSNTLFGTTLQRYAGPAVFAFGTVFALNTDGSGFTDLYGFSGSDGASPNSAVILSDNTLYGTTANGGNSANFSETNSGYGTVFAVNTDGSSFTSLYIFSIPDALTGTNSDGNGPWAGLVLSGNTLYGTAVGGGINGNGTVFSINTDGTGFTTLHSFSSYHNNSATNSDGGFPRGGLILAGTTLYGTAWIGGSGGWGTVFSLNTDGTGFTNLHSFTAPSGPYPYTNSDGGGPYASLILSGNTLYGTANGGGNSGSGTVFAVNTDGTGFTNLYSFTAAAGYNPNGWPINTDGALPYAGLILSGNTLYGTSSAGGRSGFGTVFSLSLPVTPPQLTLTASGSNLVLTWPTNATGFTLQSTTNLGASAVWTTNLPAPVIINDQNVVTNPITGTQQFFRLSQ